MASDVIQIPTLEHFRALKKTERYKLLHDLREIYSDLDIRTTWGLKYNSYYYYLTEMRKIESGDHSEPKTKEEKVKGAGTPPKRRDMGEIPGRTIIDAEYSIVSEPSFNSTDTPKPAHNPPAVIQAADPAELPMLNFKDVIGDTAQLQNRLNKILDILEMEGPEARFRLNIQIYKA